MGFLGFLGFFGLFGLFGFFGFSGSLGFSGFSGYLGSSGFSDSLGFSGSLGSSGFRIVFRVIIIGQCDSYYPCILLYYYSTRAHVRDNVNPTTHVYYFIIIVPVHM